MPWSSEVLEHGGTGSLGDGSASHRDQLRYVVLPYLRRQSDAGWPGASERDRNELTNALADLRSAVEGK